MEEKVSIVIPCRNEEKYIGTVIDNILNQDYPIELIEVLIVDGCSDDNTQEIILAYATEYDAIKLINNPEKIVPFALNKGIISAEGDYIIIMGAHSSYPKDYISTLISWSLKTGADNVGGICKAKPANDSIKALSIAEALSNIFGIGNALFRIGVNSIKAVDTVPFGCYRKEIFDKIGLFDEDLIRNQDDELNARLIKYGGKIILIPGLEISYYTRDSLYKLWEMYFQYGLFKPLVNKKIGIPSTFRQLAPPLFVLSIVSFLILSFFDHVFIYILNSIITIYLITNIFVSCRIALANKKPGLLLYIPITFFTIHLSYGIGYIKGIVEFWIINKTRYTNEIKSSR